MAYEFNYEKVFVCNIAQLFENKVLTSEDGFVVECDHDERSEKVFRAVIWTKDQQVICRYDDATRKPIYNDFHSFLMEEGMGESCCSRLNEGWIASDDFLFSLVFQRKHPYFQNKVIECSYYQFFNDELEGRVIRAKNILAMISEPRYTVEISACIGAFNWGQKVIMDINQCVIQRHSSGKYLLLQVNYANITLQVLWGTNYTI